MMKTETVIIKGDIFARYAPYTKTYEFKHWTRYNEKETLADVKKAWIKQNYIHIAPYDIEIEMPKGVDLQKSTLEVFQEQRKLILAENQVKLNQIDKQISELMAIESK